MPGFWKCLVMQPLPKLRNFVFFSNVEQHGGIRSISYCVSDHSATRWAETQLWHFQSATFLPFAFSFIKLCALGAVDLKEPLKLVKFFKILPPHTCQTFVGSERSCATKQLLMMVNKIFHEPGLKRYICWETFKKGILYYGIILGSVPDMHLLR